MKDYSILLLLVRPPSASFFLIHKHPPKLNHFTFLVVSVGPGEIWIQSMSIDKMRRLFPPKVQQSGGGGGGGDSSG